MEEMIKIQKISDDIIRRGKVTSFGVIGDPGCEGLGTSMMQIYANALQTASQNDFILIAGDFVPEGSKRHYQNICNLTNAVAAKDVFALRGNHDTGSYEEYFGKKNYAVICEDFTLIVIDNAMRTFMDEGMELLKRVLPMEACKNVVISFHIPLPNHFTGNSVSQEEYQKLCSAIGEWKEKVKYFVCGHVHSRFEDEIDGIPFICTGGGGAMIEDVSEDIRAADVDYHIIKFYFEDGVLNYQIKDLSDTPYMKEIQDDILKEKLEDAVKGELYAHLRYLTFAERAERRGFARIANLFRALAESEYRHARSFFSILDQPRPFAGTIAEFIPGEKFEYEKLYKMMSEYAKENNQLLSHQAFEDASAAEKVHARMLERAKDLNGFETETFYVCPVCGFIMEDKDDLGRCPVCGAPNKQFLKY